MVKQPTSEQSEFTMSSEDFPALPGTSAGGAPALPDHNHAPDKPRKGIQTEPEGTQLPPYSFSHCFNTVTYVTPLHFVTS
jgi:hypothetical protein